MSPLTVFLVGCLAGVSVNSLPIPKYELKLEEEDKTLIFNYLDHDRDGLLLQADRDLLFNHHPEAEPDKQKLLDLTHSQGDGSDLNSDKFETFLDDKAVTYAIFECSYIRSTSLKKQCFEDQIVTYVHLVLPNDVVSQFYKLFNSNDGIGMDQVRDLFTEGDEDQRQEDAHNFLRELGGEDEVISKAEFDQYVRQEDLHDDFRACFQPDRTYDYDCLRDKLLEYTSRSLTEMDIAVIFQAIDADGDEIIEPSDIAKFCTNKCDPETFLKMMNADQDDSTVDFGEFRTFIKKHTVKIRIERNCKGPFPSQMAELNCYSKQLFSIVSEHHKPIWLWLPDSDILFLFEDLDVDNNGKIELVEDLQKKGYTKEIAMKFLKEMDGEDQDHLVSLQEFNEYVGEPSVVYALAECMAKQRGPERTNCYKDELKLYITYILVKTVVKNFFLSFDLNNDGDITDVDLEKIIKNSGHVELFFKELGMGDNAVNRGEFSWFVRQQEPSEMYIADSCGEDTSCLQTTLWKYLLTKMTEHDFQKLFGKLVSEGEWDLGVDALKARRPEDQASSLLERMDADKDGVVNFQEFRLFLVLEGGKQKMEETCTVPKKKNAAELMCYQEEIWNV